MIWSALVMGLAGGFHCLSMCGPIVWTLHQVRSQTNSDLWRYHGGKITGYMFMGAIASLLGWGIEWVVGPKVLTIGAGLILIGFLFNRNLNGILLGSRWWRWVKHRISLLIKSRKNLYWLGVLNGWLPCGLTYAALTIAASTGDPISGISYMALFGIGTTPWLIAVVKGTGWIPQKLTSIKYMVRGSIGFLAVLLILRGMELGIPLVSPEFQPPTNSVTVCK